jgi:hypothetical protein
MKKKTQKVDNIICVKPLVKDQYIEVLDRILEAVKMNNLSDNINFSFA